MTFPRVKTSSTARGYGVAHRKERERRVRVTTPHTPCANGCGRRLGMDTTRWHLPHLPDRSGYYPYPALWCAPCNLSDGARVGARRARGRRNGRRGLKPVRRRDLLG